MTLRGQRLYIRPITPADLAELRRLKSAPDLALPPQGIVGKLVGDTVALATFSITAASELQIDEVFVEPRLRRKRVGRLMIAELEAIAARLECDFLVVAHQCEAREFFSRVGFGESRSVLRKTVTVR